MGTTQLWFNATILLWGSLFWQDRKETLQQLDEFLTTKIAPKEFVDEIKVFIHVY